MGRLPRYAARGVTSRVGPDHVVRVRRHTITLPDGSWLTLETDGEVVAITPHDRRLEDALYLSQADMQSLVDVWNAWQSG